MNNFLYTYSSIIIIVIIIIIIIIIIIYHPSVSLAVGSVVGCFMMSPPDVHDQSHSLCLGIRHQLACLLYATRMECEPKFYSVPRP